MQWINKWWIKQKKKNNKMVDAKDAREKWKLDICSKMRRYYPNNVFTGNIQ